MRRKTMLIGLRKGRHRGHSTTVGIAQGDILVLYTDGLTEAGHDIIAGTRSLCDAASTYAPAGNDHPAEFIKVREAERYIRRWRFDVGDGRAAGAARAGFVESLKARAFSQDACANAELVFGDLIGNVLRHAHYTTPTCWNSSSRSRSSPHKQRRAGMRDVASHRSEQSLSFGT